MRRARRAHPARAVRRSSGFGSGGRPCTVIHCSHSLLIHSGNAVGKSLEKALSNRKKARNQGTASGGSPATSRQAAPPSSARWQQRQGGQGRGGQGGQPTRGNVQQWYRGARGRRACLRQRQGRRGGWGRPGPARAGGGAADRAALPSPVSTTAPKQWLPHLSAWIHHWRSAGSRAV